MTKQIFYVAGVTCAGKDYFIEHCLRKYPDLYDAIQVGKVMRERHPPEYFKGSGSPAHCEAEALNIFSEELAKYSKNKKPYLLVAGQPRRVSQIEPTIVTHPGTFLWLHCDKDTQLQRINQRFADSLEGRELALARIKNDKIDLYDIIWSLMGLDIDVEPCTSDALIEYVDSEEGHLSSESSDASPYMIPFSNN